MKKKSVFRFFTPLLFCIVFLCLLPHIAVFAQSGNSNSAGSRHGENITLKLAVMGSGDELYFWFGHIGLIVENSRTGLARFYDWGVFSFENTNFFYNFAFGRLYYSCMVSDAELNLRSYLSNNRNITLYTLDLPAEKKAQVLMFAENNVRPENRDYAYHHFRDNCATRIRDILDMALDGQFSAKFADTPGRFTLRQHVRRHTWFNPFFDWILNFWMGQGIDKPITVWDEMFLPSEIALRIKDFIYTDSDGIERNLVTSVEYVNTLSPRPIVLDVPRLQWPRELVASLIVSILPLILFLLREKIKRFRVYLGLFQGLLGLFFGIAGSLLFFMMFFTNHDYTYNNSNIIFVNPLFFTAIPLGLIFAFTRNDKKRFITARLLRIFWTYILLGGLLTMLIKLSPDFYQQNQVDQALILPIALVMVLVMAGLGKLSVKGAKPRSGK